MSLDLLEHRAVAAPVDSQGSSSTELGWPAVAESLEAILAQLGQGPLVELAALGRRDDDAWTVCAIFDPLGVGPAIGDELLTRDGNDDAVQAAEIVGDSPRGQQPGTRTETSSTFKSGLYVFVPIFLSNGDEYGLFAQPSRASEILARWIAAECERSAARVAVELERQIH